MRNLLFELIQIQLPPTRLFIDNLGTVKLIKSNSKTKHLDIKLDHVRDANEKMNISVQPVSSEKQLADTSTKALPESKFSSMLKKIGMVKITLRMLMLCFVVDSRSAMFLGERYLIGPHHYTLGYWDACKIS